MRTRRRVERHVQLVLCCQSASNYWRLKLGFGGGRHAVLVRGILECSKYAFGLYAGSSRGCLSSSRRCRSCEDFRVQVQNMFKRGVHELRRQRPDREYSLTSRYDFLQAPSEEFVF